MPAKKTELKLANSKIVSHYGYCGRCHAGQILALGILVLLNAWLNLVSWASFVGIIFILVGLIKMVMPTCGHC